MKKYSRFLSVLVLLAITAGCVPFSAFAEEPLITPDTIEDTKIVEVVERREESIKHFRLPDGSYEAVSYAGAVHRKDANGVWQDIDNDLTLKTVGTKQLYTTDDSRLSFAKDYSSGSELVSINENGYVISMSMLQQQGEAISTAPMTSTVVNSNYVRPNSFDTMEEAINIENKSSIAYSNVNSNTDIEYIMQGNDLKENIIVKSKGERYEYGFQLALVGLDATLDESGAIYLCDKESEEIKYIIPAPYMYDADGDYSEAVSYSLVHAGGDKYLLVVTADEEWMNDTERTFPVTIDPSIIGNSNIAETFVDASDPTSNYGRSTQVWINPQRSALLNFSLPQIPTSPNIATFNYATLYVNYYGMVSYGTTSINVHKVTSGWNETTVTYNSLPSFGSIISNSSLTTLSGVDSISGSFNVSEAVRDFYEDSETFYGIYLKYSLGKHVIIISHEESAADALYVSVNYSYYIPDGVYAFRNEYSSTSWLSTGGATSPYNSIVCASSSESPTTATSCDPERLFRITRVGTTQQYVITLYINSGLCMEIDGSPMISVLSGSGSNISSSQTVFIEWNGSGYTLRQYGSSSVLCLSSTSNTTLTTGAQSSVGSTPRATWELVEYSVVLYGIPDTNVDHDHVTSLQYVDSSIYDQPWINVKMQTQNTTGQNCIRDLKSANVFVSRGHGLKRLDYDNTTLLCTGICLNDEQTELLLSHDITQYGVASPAIESESNFSNLDLAVFVGCETGAGGVGGNNLPSKIVQKGATAAIGFTVKIGCDDANNWTLYLFYHLHLGYTLDAAVDKACEYSSIPRAYVIICGNANLVLW